MNIKSNFLIFLILLLQFSFSNIWDNIYTQSNSPHFIIDDNFEINLLNIETNSTAGELLLSSELGLIKLSLILSELNTNDSFIQIIINFNNGKIYFDTEEKCLYKYMSLVEQLSPKFIVSAYDLLSYFSEDENNYHYIITNPFEISDNYNDTVLLLANNILNDFENNFKRYETIYDKNLYADFIIGKKENKIKGIDIKTSYGLINFKTEFKAYNLTIEQFFGIHDPEQCVEYQ
jgi:hypothetical protein